jgi:hypothetical protein
LNDQTNPATINVAYVDPLGRARTGFGNNGRSVFGREYVTPTGSIVANPFNKEAYGGTTQQIEDVIAGTFSASVLSVIPHVAHAKSPYLIMPGDKLVMSVAKTRPFVYSVQGASASFSGSAQHELRFNTGSINVTLYGSYLREFGETQTTLKQSLFTDSVHEILVGSEPVLDQFDLNHRDSFAGTHLDDYITGSMVSVTTNVEGRLTLTTGSRGKVFNRLEASQTRRYVEQNVLFSEAFRPWHQFAGDIRTSQVTSDDEIWYDSFVPSINSCVKINGADVYAWRVTGISPRALIAFNVTNENISSDDIWLRSFPFEPRYSGVIRQRGFYLAVDTTKKITGGDFGIQTISNDERRTHTGINVFVQFDGSSEPLFYGDSDRVTSPENYGTKPLSQTDSLRVLYGFGDKHAYHIDGTEAAGANNLPEYKLHPSASYMAISPIIRGWKYGLYSGIEMKSKAYWRAGHYGQVRDMLEQRPYSKFSVNGKASPSPITVRFVTPSGQSTRPENTWSSNLSFEATSSVPYFDGVSRNRNDINTNTLNQGIITFSADSGGNVTL